MREIDRIKNNYEKRKSLPIDTLYSMLLPHRIYQSQEREREILRLFRKNEITVSTARVCELGCGSGAKLQELLRYGFDPSNLFGVELLQDRYEKAQYMLPSACTLHCGDASSINLEDEYFDIVHFSTVFSSILDTGLRKQVAVRSWELLKPGGAILIYDFAYNNPSNSDVRALKETEVRELYEFAKSIEVSKITVAPPLSKRICKLLPQLYAVASLIPFFKTHRIYWIEKAE